jgi:membrane-associated phospholipid phosphatase
MLFFTDPNIALQVAAPGLGWLMLCVSLLGAPEFYIIILPFVYWCYDQKLGLRLLLLLAISTAANGILKILFHDPRPYWIDPGVQALASESSFGLPSGAAQCSLTFLGTLAIWFRTPRAYAACAGLILLVGVARLYLGVHFLIDILAGWEVALVILFIYYRYESRGAAWLAQQPACIRIITVFSASVLLAAVAGFLLTCLGTWDLPAAWADQAYTATGIPINPLSPRDVLMAAGILFGAGAGAVISGNTFLPGARGTRMQKTARYLVGIAVMIVIWAGLSAAAKSPGIYGDAMAYVRAAIAGFWITAGAPFLFSRLGLARTEEPMP